MPSEQKNPAEHIKQALCPIFEYVPSEQTVCEFRVVSLQKYPAGHSVQYELPVSENLPEEQGNRVSGCSGEEQENPAGQGSQAVEPLCEKNPGRHGKVIDVFGQ
jgi:hypothetical protein